MKKNAAKIVLAEGRSEKVLCKTLYKPLLMFYSLQLSHVSRFKSFAKKVSPGRKMSANKLSVYNAARVEQSGYRLIVTVRQN